MTSEFWVVVGIGLVLYGGLIVVAISLGPRWFHRQFHERQESLDKRERFLANLVTKSEATYKDLEATVAIYRDLNRAKETQIIQMAQEIQALRIELATLREQLETEAQTIADLKHQLESTQTIDQPAEASEFSVLGIWPDAPGQPPLDTQGEADALYNAGYAYTALRGPRANRAGVILEIDRVRPTVIQVGGHGNSEGILLSDGVAEPGFWGQVVAGKGIALMVLLSCDSSQQDEINISDALVTAGVQAVVSCDDQIADADAVRFASLLYGGLANKMTLSRAVQRAKLSVSRKAAEMIRLREAPNAKR